MGTRVWLFGWFLFGMSLVLGWGGCRGLKPKADGVVKDSGVDDASVEAFFSEQSPERSVSRPEPRPPEPQPEPDVVDTGPSVPEKVLVNGIQGIVIHVIDGDTIYVAKRPGGWGIRIRLKGFNAPECFKKRSSVHNFEECDRDDEYYGLEAYRIMKRLAMGEFRKATIVCVEKKNECEKDIYGRYLAYLELPDGRDLGAEMLRAGGGWSFTSFKSKKVAEYCRAEADAIRAKAGMWKQGRAFVRQRMHGSTVSWYYNKNRSRSHDEICSQAMGESFAKRAGE